MGSGGVLLCATSLYLLGSLGVVGSGTPGDVLLLAPSRPPCCPRSTEASPELCARILESLIVASEAAEVPAAPGKGHAAGGGVAGGRAGGTARGWSPGGPVLPWALRKAKLNGIWLRFGKENIALQQ